MQVMVLAGSSTNDGSDYYVDPASGYYLAYAKQLPKGASVFTLTDYDLCFLFTDPMHPDNVGGPSNICEDPNVAGTCSCPATADGDPVTCATQGNLIGHCVVDGNLPPVTHAQSFQSSIRVVTGKLMNPTTLEHFACACQFIACSLAATDDDDPTDDRPGNECVAPIADKSKCLLTCGIQHTDIANCATAANAWAADIASCGSCSAELNDTLTQGKCLDVDQTGLPDLTSLIPGVATVTCGAGVGAGSPLLHCPTGWSGATSGTCAYLTQEGDGFYYPSGNQFTGSATGIGGVGPAITINVNGSTTLPADSSCTVSISDSVKTKDGETLTVPANKPVFRTETVNLGLISPGAGDELNTTKDITITVESNVPLDPGATFTMSTVITDVNATTPNSVVFTANTAPSNDGLDVTQKIPAGAFIGNPDHIYTVHVNATATDIFGVTSDVNSHAVNATTVQ